MNQRQRFALLQNSSFRALLEFELDSHRMLYAAASVDERQELYKTLYPVWSRRLREFLATQPPSTNGGDGALGFAPVFLEWFRSWLTRQDILELGCGAGQATFHLLKLARHVTALDVDPVLLNETRARCPGAAVVESSLGIPLPFRSESFDTVYWNDVAEHLHPEDLRFSLREIHRVLRDGGRLCTVTCHRDDGPHDSSMAILPRGSPPQGMHLQEFTYERWNWELMHAGFAAAQPVIGVNVLTKLRLTRVIPTLLSSWSPLLLLEDTSPNRAATLLRWVSGTNVICSIGTKGNPVGPAVVESSPQAG